VLGTNNVTYLLLELRAGSRAPRHGLPAHRAASVDPSVALRGE
jgi:hypothetical protein